MQPTLRRAISAFAVVIAGLALASCGINSIPTKQEAAKEKWADVQSAYQRRADLIPNLVATVQGAAIQERTVLVGVTEARAKATGITVDANTVSDPAKLQAFQQAQDQLSGALGRLLAVSENYPTLQSNQNFLTLQSQLEGTENRINVARHDYNLAVQDYNTTLRTLPTSIWAGTFYRDAKPMEPFAASAAAQTAPTVQFNLGGGPTGGSGVTNTPVPANTATP